MASRSKVADYPESLEILTKLARAGDTRAAIALAGHLRKENAVIDPVQREISQIAAARRRRERERPA